ncbi:MAG TPA: VOC family protein [Saprospiraceae bacterium]|nr:VOC family protein [Saprospiraceae bacterium]HPN69138.1 VOC family protein [Saprospiraceae bacterium]
MTKLFAKIAILSCIGFCACSNPKESKSDVQETAVTGIANQKSENMTNIISIVEIPVSDFNRAVTFYQSIMGLTIEEVEMAGTQMGIIPSDMGTVSVVLAKGSDYKPTTDGAVLYLNAGEDLQPMLDKVAQNGGEVFLPKTEISPEMGYFALFMDTEGNKLGLHSIK